jgi:hypothetical protein
MTSILEAHLNSTQDWGMVRSEIVDTFLPPRAKERYLRLYVLDRFQSSSEDLNGYIMAVVTASKILGFEGGSLGWFTAYYKIRTLGLRLIFCSRPNRRR